MGSESARLADGHLEAFAVSERSEFTPAWKWLPSNAPSLAVLSFLTLL